MPGGDDPTVMGHSIDHMINRIRIAHVAGSSLRPDRGIDRYAQQSRDRARRPDNPGLRQPSEFIKACEGAFGPITIDRLGRMPDCSPFLDELRNMGELSRRERRGAHRSLIRDVARVPLRRVLPLPSEFVTTLGDVDRVVLLMHKRGARFADFKERAPGPALAEQTYRTPGEGMRVTGQFAQGYDD